MIQVSSVANMNYVCSFLTDISNKASDCLLHDLKIDELYPSGFHMKRLPEQKEYIYIYIYIYHTINLNLLTLNKQ